MTDINWFDIEKGALPCPFCGEKEIIRQQMWFTDYVEHPEWRFHEDGTRKWTFLKCSRCNNQKCTSCGYGTHADSKGNCVGCGISGCPYCSACDG